MLLGIAQAVLLPGKFRRTVSELTDFIGAGFDLSELREVEFIGEILLDGRDVYHVSGQISPSALGGIPEEFSVSDGMVRLEYWIGTDDRLVRRARLRFEEDIGGELVEMRLVLRMSGYGEEFNIVAPVMKGLVESDVGLNCDAVLRSQLVFQRGASTAANMNVVIGQIQAQRQECTLEAWDPDVVDMPAAASAEMCWNQTSAAATGVAGTEGPLGKVGASQVPRGLRIGNEDDGLVRALSGRDSDNDIIVYWSTVANRPSDGAKCWLYVARLRTWSENY